MYPENGEESSMKLSRTSRLALPLHQFLHVYPDFEKPFTLHVDASCKGLGAILYQDQDGKLQVVAYASRYLAG